MIKCDVPLHCCGIIRVPRCNSNVFAIYPLLLFRSLNSDLLVLISYTFKASELNEWFLCCLPVFSEILCFYYFLIYIHLSGLSALVSLNLILNTHDHYDHIHSSSSSKIHTNRHHRQPQNIYISLSPYLSSSFFSSKPSTSSFHLF